MKSLMTLIVVGSALMAVLYVMPERPQEPQQLQVVPTTSRARAVTWGSAYTADAGLALPATPRGSMTFCYDAATQVWQEVAEKTDCEEQHHD